MRSRLVPMLGALVLFACEPEPERQIWDVAAHPAMCDDAELGRLCPIYARADGSEIGDFDYLEGFTPEWGHTYQIEVERREHDPNDETPINSLTYYVLVDVLVDEPEPALEFAIDLRIATVDLASGTGEVGLGLPFTCTPELCQAIDAVIVQGWDVAAATQATFRFGEAEALLPVTLVSIGE